MFRNDMWIIYLAISVTGQFGLWALTARLIYRNYKWGRKTHEEDRRMLAGLWGFLWPGSLVFLLLYALATVIGKAETAPSLRERKAEKAKVKRERLSDLDKQTRIAEAELSAVTRQLEQGT